MSNPLLRAPLRPEQIKPRLLGHWKPTPGLNFIYVHFNRAIIEHSHGGIRQSRARRCLHRRRRRGGENGLTCKLHISPVLRTSSYDGIRVAALEFQTQRARATLGEARHTGIVSERGIATELRVATEGLTGDPSARCGTSGQALVSNGNISRLVVEQAALMNRLQQRRKVVKKLALLVVLSLVSVALYSQSPEQQSQSSAEATQRMERMQAQMQSMRALMAQIQATTDPAERARLMQAHMQSMHQGMMMMGQMMQGSMMGGAGSGGQCAQDDTQCQMNQMRMQQGMMGRGMGMMQQMMGQMMDQMMLMQPSGNEAQKDEPH